MKCLIGGVSILFLLLHCATCRKYNGYKVYEVTPENSIQTSFFHILAKNISLDVWKESRIIGDTNEVMVEPRHQSYFEKELTENGLKFSVLMDDVERLIAEEKNEGSLQRSAHLGGVTFRNYMLYEEHMAYLRNLAQSYPNLVTLETIGHSHEGRDILLLRISSGPSKTSAPKPIIFIDAGIHCREWIAPPVALYAIQQLVENVDNSQLYENIDWAIVPNLNPDGYEYTQKVDRLWRKNRRLSDGQNCYGTDLNRNFGYYWMHAGASDNSCDDTYAGPEAFSEPESRAVRDWFLQNGHNVKLYLSFHSYGEYILYPWGYDNLRPDDDDELNSLGERVALAIKNASNMNSSYTVDPSAIGLYPAAGGSDDWVKGVCNISLAYTIELPHGDSPFHFMLPARQILMVAQETFEGIKEFHSYIEEKFIFSA